MRSRVQGTCIHGAAVICIPTRISSSSWAGKCRYMWTAGISKRDLWTWMPFRRKAKVRGSGAERRLCVLIPKTRPVFRNRRVWFSASDGSYGASGTKAGFCWFICHFFRSFAVRANRCHCSMRGNVWKEKRRNSSRGISSKTDVCAT